MPDLADRFPPLAPERAATWGRFGRWERAHFAKLVGLEVEEIREGYCRMRLPYRPELNQAAGLVHGGAIATLVDTVVVPAIGSAYDELPRMVTVTMNLQFLGPVAGQDAVAEGWVEQRGRSLVFCRAEVRSAEGRAAANATLVYKVDPSRPLEPPG